MAQIDKPNLYFNTKLYTGNGGTQSITGVGFQPDLVWIKNRERVEDHILYDAVRGATKRISSNNTNAESTKSNGVTAFDSDGFSLGSAGQNNYNGDAIASWNWKANGQGSSNTTGTINTTYTSANTTSGFSIIKFTGNGTGSATIGHGLGTKPRMIMLKNLTDADSWIVWFDTNGSNTSNGRMSINASSVAETTANSMITVSDTLITLPSLVNAAWNGSSKDYVVYAFANIKGFSKFGSYKGNGNTDGPFCYTGFSPAYIWIKSTTYAGNWLCFDNQREVQNRPSGNPLNLNETGVESANANYAIDFLSNGFKLRNNNGNIQNNTETMIYMSFAKHPIVGSNDIPATAV